MLLAEPTLLGQREAHRMNPERRGAEHADRRVAQGQHPLGVQVLAEQGVHELLDMHGLDANPARRLWMGFRTRHHTARNHPYRLYIPVGLSPAPFHGSTLDQEPSSSMPDGGMAERPPNNRQEAPQVKYRNRV